MRMFKLRSPHGEAERNVPEQPEIYYSTIDNSEKYNGRKLSELPFHLIRSKRVDELFKLVLFRYKFLYAKLCCNPLNNLIADFEDYLDNFGYQKEVVLIADALRLSSSILSVSPTNLVPQLVGRLLPYYFKNSKKFENVKRLIEECETDGLYNSALIPAFNCLATLLENISLSAKLVSILGFKSTALCIFSFPSRISWSNRFRVSNILLAFSNIFSANLLAIKD